MGNSNRQRSQIVAAILLLIILVGMAGHVSAQSPTETSTPAPSVTPTLLPIVPSPTSFYIYLHPTPTLLVFHPENYTLSINPDSAQMADQAINIYRGFNQGHIIDAVVFFLVAGMLAIYLVRWLARSTKDD